MSDIREGIYFLCKAKEVVYVGQSWDVYKRVNEHSVLKDFDSAFAMPVPTELLDEVERYWIDRIKPKLNKYQPLPQRKLKLLGWVGDWTILQQFKIDKETLYKLADAGRIKTKFINPRHKGIRLFWFPSARDLLEASVS